MSKAGINVANTNSQAVTAGNPIALGTAVHRYGCKNGQPIINLVNNGIVLNECGYYKITANVTAAPTADGPVTVTLLQDGNPIPGARATNTAAAAGNAVSVTAIGTVKISGCNVKSVITAVLTAGTGNVTNVAVNVYKE